MSLPPLPPPSSSPHASGGPPPINLDEDEDNDAVALLSPTDDGVDKARTLDTRSMDHIRNQLAKMTFLKPPIVHPYPAPDVVPPAGDPTLFQGRVPPRPYVARSSYLDRFLNSTSGRFFVFACTLGFMNLGIYGFVNYNRPSFREPGLSFYYSILAFIIFATTFTIPLLAPRAGMNAAESGWKPYLVLWRLGLFLGLPACYLQVSGDGQQNAWGEPAGVLGEIKVTEIENVFWNYFETSNGFVALNLTKGIVETLAPAEHGVKKHRRISRYRDAELRINREPYSDVPEPTETPGRLATYRLAPIFESWAPCVTNYRISARCLRRNPVKAWAVSKSTSICSSYKSVGCRPPKPFLEPVYNCGNGKGGTPGASTTMPMDGFCGHVTSPPPEGAIDELSALLLYDAWPKIALPKPDTLWLNVDPDPCISDPDACKAMWSTLTFAGFALQMLGNAMVVVAAFLDLRVDGQIRKARKLFLDEQRAKALAEAAANGNRA